MVRCESLLRSLSEVTDVATYNLTAVRYLTPIQPQVGCEMMARGLWYGFTRQVSFKPATRLSDVTAHVITWPSQNFGLSDSETETS